MPKPIKNYIVGVRQGGDTRYTTYNLIVGAKSERDAIEYAKQESGKYHHYSCHRTQYTPRVSLREGQVIRNSTGAEMGQVEIDGEIYLVTDERREIEQVDNEGVIALTVQRKYVKRYARKETDVLWQTLYVWTGEKEIEDYRTNRRRYANQEPGPIQKTYHPMRNKNRH